MITCGWEVYISLSTSLLSTQDMMFLHLNDIVISGHPVTTVNSSVEDTMTLSFTGNVSAEEKHTLIMNFCVNHIDKTIESSRFM